MILRADLLEGFAVRRAWEIEAARLAAQHRSDADVVRLRELAARRESAYRTSSAEYRRADIALHEHLLAATGNALLADLYRGLVDPLRVAIAARFEDSELTRDDPDRPEMRNLITAIEDRDPQAAAAAAERQMDGAIRVLRFLLQVVIVEG